MKHNGLTRWILTGDNTSKIPSGQADTPELAEAQARRTAARLGGEWEMQLTDDDGELVHCDTLRPAGPSATDFFGFETEGGSRYDEERPLHERIRLAEAQYGDVILLEDSSFGFAGDPTGFHYPSRHHARQARAVAVRITALLWGSVTVEDALTDAVHIALDALKNTI